MDYEEIYKAVEELHVKYWQRALELLPKIDNTEVPECRFHCKKVKVTGKANSVWCDYNIAWVLAAGVKEYSRTISHEIAHIYVKRANAPYASPHGDLFHFVWRTVCYDNEYTNFYSHAKRDAMYSLAKTIHQLHETK